MESFRFFQRAQIFQRLCRTPLAAEGGDVGGHQASGRFLFVTQQGAHFARLFRLHQVQETVGGRFRQILEKLGSVVHRQFVEEVG